MVDVLTPDQRKLNMSRIRGKDTKPEIAVRRLIHALGFRFRLHVRTLPGKPDVVFRSRRKVIFVHGCYWHMHACRFGRVKPSTNAEFWRRKRESNVIRDRRALRQLRLAGWRVLVIWECQVGRETELSHQLKAFLERTE